MKTFNELQMRDPWSWCLDMIEKHNISSKMLSDAVDAPRSTIRALYNGSNKAPRYELLTDVIFLCINLENGRPGPWEIAASKKRIVEPVITAPKGVSVEEVMGELEPEPEPVQEFDFL